MGNIMARLLDLDESSRARLLKLECPLFEKHPKSLGALLAGWTYRITSAAASI